jgi:hypothetical protein
MAFFVGSPSSFLPDDQVIYGRIVVVVAPEEIKAYRFAGKRQCLSFACPVCGL